MNSSNIINGRNLLENINCKYILELLFNNLPKTKSLELIRYNKKIQSILNKSLKSYKMLSQIEIDIELTKFTNIGKKFINILYESDKSYYHIYFNKNKKDMKRNYLTENDDVSKIKIIIDSPVLSFCGLFKNCDCIKSINFKKFYRSNIDSMRGMFFGCSSLKKLILSNFNTKN